MRRDFVGIVRTAAVFVSLVTATAPARAQIYEYATKDPGNVGALGTSVARLGDLNHDGYEDFIVGEPQWYYGAGAIYVISGVDGSLLFGGQSLVHQELGAAVAGDIDVDSDSYPDALLGVPAVGYVYVFSVQRNVYAPIGFGGNGGTSVRSLQDDLDADGVDDFIVGVPSADEAYVISGGSVFTHPTYIYKLKGESGSNFGFAVSRGGNLDGDGIDDFVVGNPQFVDGAGNTTGKITAYAGKDGSKLWSIDGVADSRFGHAIDAPGDLDGDSYTDLVVGAPQHDDPGGVKTGCATVISGFAGTVMFKAFGDNANDDFGHDVRTVGGDVDQDGTRDFVVGAPESTGSDDGYARTISGANGNVICTYTQHAGGKGDYGESVAGGNFTGGSRPDVVIGGPAFSGGDGIAEMWRTFAASWNNYGSGWSGTLGVPSFTPRSNPVVGKSLKIDLDNSLGATTSGILVLGLSQTSLTTGKGGKLLVDPLMFIPLSIPAGGLTISGAIPNDPALYGVDLDLQALEVDAGASKGVSFTQGLDLSFGGP
jgi:hypothetical protein